MELNNFAEKIFYNGTIITMNENQKHVEAVATQGQYIIACGNLKEVEKYTTSSTEYVDLQGKTMLPGFIDAHSHIYDCTNRAFWVDVNSVPLGTVKGIQDIISLLQEKAKNTPEGEWVVGWGYDDSNLAENRHPNRFDLDQVSTKHPVAINHISGWTTVANSYALEKCGIDKNYQNTSSSTIERDEQGDATGLLKSSICPILSQVPKLNSDDFKKGLQIVAKQYLAKGCTTAQDGWWSELEYLSITKEALDSKELNIRFVLYPIAESDEYEALKTILPQNVSGEYLDDNKMICMGATKLTMDGSIQAYTAYLSEPYFICPEDKGNDYKGKPNNTQEWLNDRLLDIHKAGKQIAVHCNGDGAIEMTINAMEYVQKNYYREDPRFIFIHCQTARPDQLERIAKLKATISFFVVHTYFWGERHTKRFLGQERALRINPVQEALELGINVTLHNDTYVTPMDPLLLAWSAVNRQSYQGNDMGKKEQGCSVEDAFKALTINSAIQGFEEKEKGSIEKGKLADFVILEENPFEIDPMKIKDINIIATIVGANVAYGII